MLAVSIYLIISSKNTEPDSNDHKQTVLKHIDTNKSRQKPDKIYGIDPSSYEIKKGKVEPNEFLAEILRDYGVPYPTIHELVQKSENVFDMSNIKKGNFYCAFNEQDTLNRCSYFVYEIDPVNYVIFEFMDTVRVYKGQKEVKTKEKTASGVIDNSLYMKLDELDLSPLLANKMAEIFAWTVDFYRIRENDRFKVIYNEKFVDGESIGIGKVQAAYFNHYNESYYAFPFEQDGDREFYNKQGENVRKQFLKAPLDFKKISSRYTRKRYHPVLNQYREHLGTDYAASPGTPIKATANGTIIAARYGKYNGNFVKIRHNSVYSTQYLHMSSIKNGIAPGASVSQGDVIGYVGSTGLATGPHLCYRFWKNGEQVDPYQQDFPSAEPVKEQNMEAFKASFQSITTQLEALDYASEQTALLDK
ncbi:MAG: peptidase M23 [Bacteroidetes bacterium SW_10_40_5]|nr:MAG: peptidase M23 [Bacteroidetes bacterium SW_10_40_5]